MQIDGFNSSLKTRASNPCQCLWLTTLCVPFYIWFFIARTGKNKLIKQPKKSRKRVKETLAINWKCFFHHHHWWWWWWWWFDIQQEISCMTSNEVLFFFCSSFLNSAALTSTKLAARLILYIIHRFLLLFFFFWRVSPAGDLMKKRCNLGDTLAWTFELTNLHQSEHLSFFSSVFLFFLCVKLHGTTSHFHLTADFSHATWRLWSHSHGAATAQTPPTWQAREG